MDGLRNLSQIDDETVQQEKRLEESYRGLTYLTYSIVVRLSSSPAHNFDPEPVFHSPSLFAFTRRLLSVRPSLPVRSQA
jgi:hypothetical protein